jgi:hypothetical protein
MNIISTIEVQAHVRAGKLAFIDKNNEILDNLTISLEE